MRKAWKYKYGENEIDVIEKDTKGELIINGQLQESKGGIHKCELKGKLESGEEVTATISSGVFKNKCTLLVDNKLVLPMGEVN